MVEERATPVIINIMETHNLSLDTFLTFTRKSSKKQSDRENSEAKKTAPYQRPIDEELVKSSVKSMLELSGNRRQEKQKEKKAKVNSGRIRQIKKPTNIFLSSENENIDVRKHDCSKKAAPL